MGTVRIPSTPLHRASGPLPSLRVQKGSSQARQHAWVTIWYSSRATLVPTLSSESYRAVTPGFTSTLPSQKTVEHDRRQPSVRTLAKVAKALDVEVKDLF